MPLVRLVAEVRCRRCRDLMSIGAVAIMRPVYQDTTLRYAPYHPECLIDVEPTYPKLAMLEGVAGEPAELVEVSIGDGVREPGRAIDFPGKEALIALATQRQRAQFKIDAEASARRVRKVVEGGARLTQRSEIALDRKGRPRVCVLWAQLGDEHLPTAAQRDALLPDGSFASSRREYVFIEASKHAPVELPWQPVIGALFVLSSQAKVTRRVLERLLQWRSFSLGAPVLWVLGPAGGARDAVEQQMRALLEEAGFAGDEARSVASERLDEPALVSLGAALDEGLSIEAPKARAIDPRENALATLEQMLRDERTVGYASALRLVSKRLRGMSPEMKARAADCAIAAMAFEPAAKAALELLARQPHNRGADALCARLGAWLGEARTVSKLHSQLWDYLGARAIDERFSVVLALLTAERRPSARAERWISLMSGSSRAEDADALDALRAGLDPADPRRDSIEGAIAAIRANARRAARERASRAREAKSRGAKEAASRRASNAASARRGIGARAAKNSRAR